MTAEQVLSAVVLAVVTAGLVTLGVRSWRSREAASSATTALPTRPADLGAARTGPMEGVYVSTVDAADPLTRLPAHGLGRRSAVVVQVHDAGVVMVRRGETDVVVPLADLVGAHRASGVAGKHVGGEGLVLVRWRLVTDGDERTVDTGLRLRHPADRATLVDAVQALVTDAPAGATAPATPLPTPTEEP